MREAFYIKIRIKNFTSKNYKLKIRSSLMHLDLFIIFEQ